MNYTKELQKFVTSQYIYSGTRIALAIVIPSIILAYFGILKEFFLFPLGTSFVGLADMAGPFIRRRNAMLLSIVSFFAVAVIASVLKDFPPLIFIEIILFGIFFSMIGVYGQRFAAVGGLTLVVFSIFVDGHLTGESIWKSLFIFLFGCIWFFIVFLIVSRIQPYKLASQLIGENYLQLADYLRIKAKFYEEKANPESLYPEVISKQINIKNLQEETREVVFKTRTIVNESTTYSRLLMLMFLHSIDFYEKLITSDQDYKKLHENFDHYDVLKKIHEFLIELANELEDIGINLQIGQKKHSDSLIDEKIQKVYDAYFDLRNRKLSSENFENFMMLRMTVLRITQISDDVKTIHKVLSQDSKLAKSLSTGLDFEKFIPKQEKLNSKVFFNNFSLKSSHFRHAIRITAALLIGYSISKLSFLGIGHSYWILITIIAIMRPAYSTTKHRNLLRLYGTISGAVVAYFILIFVHNNAVLLALLLTNMILCFAFLKEKYAWAVFFMTIYIFITFNFLNPGNVNQIFKDRILDTAIAGVIAFLISYFVLPVWEHTQNLTLMKKSAADNLQYFKTVIKNFENKTTTVNYKVRRKDAIISLANLSDNFQRMLSDPKNQQQKLESVHQFVNTAHLITAYTASLSQFSSTDIDFNEIDFENWERKISSEMETTLDLLENNHLNIENINSSSINPTDTIEDLLEKRKNEISENEPFNLRDPQRISRLTQLKNIREILELLSDVTHEQRKVVENYQIFKKETTLGS